MFLNILQFVFLGFLDRLWRSKQKTNPKKNLRVVFPCKDTAASVPRSQVDLRERRGAREAWRQLRALDEEVLSVFVFCSVMLIGFLVWF